MPQPRKNGAATPSVATSAAVPPTSINSEDFTSRPTRNSKNITPSCASASRNAPGAIHPRTLGPINTPAMISPTMPGWCSLSKTSANSLADPKTTSMASGMAAASLPPASTIRRF